MPEKPTKISDTAYGPMEYSSHDTRVGKALEFCGEWGESEFEVFRQVLKPGDVVVDAGAYIGTHAVFFAKLVGEQGSVYAFEPQRFAFEMLCRNAAQNASANIYARNEALGSLSRTIRVPKIDYSRPGDFAAYSASYEIKPGEQSSEVPMIRLDDLRLDRCKLLKVDVDGDELDILQGGTEFLSRLRPVVFVENNVSARGPALISLLEAAKYTLYWHLDFAFRRNNFRRHEHDIFDAAFDVNILAIPSERNATLSNFTPVLGPSDTWESALERSKRS